MIKVPAVKKDWKHESIVYGSKGQDHPLNSTWCRLPTSIGSCVRFNWLHLTGESRQFIHTVTVEALTLPLLQCESLTLY